MLRQAGHSPSFLRHTKIYFDPMAVSSANCKGKKIYPFHQVCLINWEVRRPERELYLSPV
ncbi:hypothetical protein I7I50_06727 [Histoplasma capsulatum G186AR]|uniref:Uncharacterized protein n=1 Tax=Ajellomyces capsulatus TaxID=5037 RepID=A0A8H8D4T0_AJECA|nr:hypothetical protein I7I52_10200 [Histoplasma capsulatum]QSS67596.1 hypothetical protein I7I50_06727 [Histoplasma capsulatum G186AR]